MATFDDTRGIQGVRAEWAKSWLSDVTVDGRNPASVGRWLVPL